MKLTFTVFLLLFLNATVSWAQNPVTLSGYVREKGSKELLPGVSVYVANSTIGTVTNAYGFYSITLNVNEEQQVVFSYVGYEPVIELINSTSDKVLNIDLKPGNELKEVTVSAQSQNERISEQVQMSKIAVPIDQIKKVPALLGEKDVLKVLQLMPGVQSGSEGQAGLYVRGGGPDQNLLILDDATVYNANHLFGFFSVFNGDALKSVELTKGGFPARYGGRLSSVIDMQLKDGSKDKLHGEGGIGLIASRLTLEGPLTKNKNASFLISGRRTYLDVLAQPFISNTFKDPEDPSSKGKTGYFFHDINAKLNYDFGQKDKLYLSGYFGQDKFYLNQSSNSTKDRSTVGWGNKTGTLRWNHLFNQKLFANTSLIFSHFKFSIDNESLSINESDTTSYGLNYQSSVRDLGIKTDFDFYLNSKNSIKFGAAITNHLFKPSAAVFENDFLGQIPGSVTNGDFVSTEGGVYMEDVFQVTPNLKMNAGFRLSYFQSRGKTYLRPEPRASMAWKWSKDFSFKASYAKMNQYVHLLSNTGIGLPTDLWVPTTDRVAPQQSEQIAIGFAKDLPSKNLTFSLEGYYKDMKHIINYKEGASFMSLDGDVGNLVDWQDQITTGIGWSQGLEFLIQKKSGRFSGWVGYTLSKTQWKFKELNEGKPFFPRYDRRNDISVVGIFELNDHISLSGTWIYGTGNALTLPMAQYYTPFDQQTIYPTGNYNFKYHENTYYGAKNSFRAEAYHRLDLAIQLHKQKKRHERTWEFGLYNAYNRKNPFYYQIKASDSEIDYSSSSKLQRVSLFPVVPSFSYQFKF